MSNTNIFLILNLGCEMLYVIEQRLKAQAISMDKSAQVIRDLTTVLLDQRFLVQLMNTSEYDLLSPNQSRILLTDVACCSLMKLDTISMDKLWDLMIMIFKWQINFTKKDINQLLHLTFKHLDGIGKLIPEMRKTILIDCAKKTLLNFWERFSDDDKIKTRNNLIKWLKSFNVKISILIRLGFQKIDSKFEENLNTEHFQSYIKNLGENIYCKNDNITTEKLTREEKVSMQRGHEIDTFIDQLNFPSAPKQSTINIINNIVLDEIHLESDTQQNESTTSSDHEFIRIENLSTIDNLLEKLNFTNEIENKIEEIDITESLLGMLDEET